VRDVPKAFPQALELELDLLPLDVDVDVVLDCKKIYRAIIQGDQMRL
jgi:hypothetical protein